MKFVFLIFVVVSFLLIFIVETSISGYSLIVAGEKKERKGIKSEHLRTVEGIKKLNSWHYNVFLYIAKLLEGCDGEGPVRNKTVLEERVVEKFKRDSGVCIGYRDIDTGEGDKDAASKADGMGKYDKYAKSKGDAIYNIMFSENKNNQTSNFYVVLRQEKKSPTRLTLYQGGLDKEKAYRIDISDLENINEEDYTEIDVAKLLAEITRREVGILGRLTGRRLDKKASF